MRHFWLHTIKSQKGFPIFIGLDSLYRHANKKTTSTSTRFRPSWGAPSGASYGALLLLLVSWTGTTSLSLSLSLSLSSLSLSLSLSLALSLPACPLASKLFAVDPISFPTRTC
jgi:hypothetical protein